MSCYRDPYLLLHGPDSLPVAWTLWCLHVGLVCILPAYPVGYPSGYFFGFHHNLNSKDLKGRNPFTKPPTRSNLHFQKLPSWVFLPLTWLPNSTTSSASWYLLPSVLIPTESRGQMRGLSPLLANLWPAFRSLTHTPEATSSHPL